MMKDREIDLLVTSCPWLLTSPTLVTLTVTSTGSTKSKILLLETLRLTTASMWLLRAHAELTLNLTCLRY